MEVPKHEARHIAANFAKLAGVAHKDGGFVWPPGATLKIVCASLNRRRSRLSRHDQQPHQLAASFVEAAFHVGRLADEIGSAANPNVSGRRSSPARTYAISPPTAVPEVSTTPAGEMAAAVTTVKAAMSTVPVAPTSKIAELHSEADDVICLENYEPFGAIGAYYADFRQVSDGEVIYILERLPLRKAVKRETSTV